MISQYDFFLIGEVAFLVFGLFFGSFLNVLADRLPRGEDVIFTRSHCDFCKKPLAWWELIPLLSYISLHGRCSKCHRKLSWQYPLMEFVTGLLFAIVWSVSAQNALALLAALTLASALLVITVSDMKYQIIPDSMVLIGSAAASVYFFTLNPETILVRLASGCVAAFFLMLIWMVTRGRGIGYGDVKLAFLAGLVTGYPGIIVTMYTAFLTGATVGVILIITRAKTLKSKIAFGPFLIAGMLVSLIFGNSLIVFWKGVAGI